MAVSLFALLVVASSLINHSVSYEPRNHEVEALIRIREGLKDPHGALANWDGDSVDPCSWAMITCSPENLVIGLGAPSQSLSGTISEAISNLTNLRQVLFQNNNISGRIPGELGSLSKLHTLDLSNNVLSGSVPDSLGQLSSLLYLRLNNNTLSGAFPVSLSKIPQLSFLDLSYNNLTGPVPKFPARTFNIVGNPAICGGSSRSEGCSVSATPIPPSLSLGSTPGKKKARKKAAVAAGVSGSVGMVVVVWAGAVWRRRRRNGSSEKEEEEEEGNLRRFSLKELQRATQGFSAHNILGSGGFGNVYKGTLPNGTLVAVKRLKDVTAAAGESQFRTELEMISLAVHRNLLRLIGFCATHSERLLVYPFMPNASVAARLRGKPGLEWSTRKRIAIGAARGLVYLHEQCDPKIIHRDVKAANVLLDECHEAVVGDFGLAKLLEHGESHVTTAVRGTVGHIAPEYLSTGQSSEKTDVFGFGILLLELVTGMRALEFAKTLNQKGAMRKIKEERKVEALVDRELGSGYDALEVLDMVHVALLCTQYLPAHRPKMSQVLRMLEGEGLADHPSDDDDHHSLDSYAMELSGPR